MVHRASVLFFVSFLCGTLGAWAQEAPSDTLALRTWDVGLGAKLSASQAAYENWQEGGLSTLAFTTSLDGEAQRLSQSWEQNHELRLAYGLVQQDTLDARKAEDLIRLTTALKYLGTGFFRVFNPTVALRVRTQFAPGFNYDEVPDVLAPRTLPVKVSDMLSPGTFTQSVGLTYDPTPWFTQRLGIGTKETVVLIERLRPVYGVSPGRPVRLEAGLESMTEFDREIFENVRLKSVLNLFAAFNQPGQPDMIWENLVTMQVNSWLGVDLEITTLYDDDVSTALQFKEVLSLGITLALI